MVSLKKISLYELPDLIYRSYDGDKLLLDKYHIQRFSLINAVQSTFSMIHTASRIKQLCIYKVVYEKQPIGYVVTYDGNFLYSYAIAVKFRKKSILADWWQQVKKVLDKDFSTMIYGNNERAINFLKRNNMEVIQEDKQNNVLTLQNSR